MKTIVVLMAVALALVGAATAWEETNTLSYNYQKDVKTQAGEHLGWFDNTLSGAGFVQPNDPYGGRAPTVSLTGGLVVPKNGADDSYALVLNQLKDITAVSNPINGQPVNTHDILTQYGSAKVFEEAPDTQAPCESIYTASATAGENIALSGLYSKAQASLANAAFVGVADYNAWTMPETSGLHTNQVQIEAEPGGDHGSVAGTVFSEANMGSQATVGIDELQAPGALATLSGSFTQWGGFAGAYNAIDPTKPASVDVNTAPAADDASGHLGATAEQQFFLDHSA